MKNESVSKRFVNEEIAIHWLVDQDEESFTRLLEHIQINTHFYYGFCKAFEYLLTCRQDDNLVIADIGGGVGWTSAIMAKHPRVKKVYLVEPSQNRINSFDNICKHLNVIPNKVESISGNFVNFSLPEKVDIVVMCASIHHCHDDYLDDLFRNINEFLKHNRGKAIVLIANEHYVNSLYSLKRLLSLMKHFVKGSKPYWNVSNLRHYHPNDFEHWRTKSELDTKIFGKYQFRANYKLLNVDLCDDKPMWEWLTMWRYYYAVLDKIQ